MSLKRRQTTLFHRVFNKVTLPQGLQEPERKWINRARGPWVEGLQNEGSEVDKKLK